MTNEEEPAEGHTELARERWQAHREKHDGEKELSEQKWKAHVEQHASIARNLAEYKIQSNEWRASLSDMRTTFVSNTEAKSLLGQAEGTHVGLLTKIESVDADLQHRFDELTKRLDTEREERRDQYNLRIGVQKGMSQTTAILVGVIGVVGSLLAILVVVLNLATKPL